MQNYFNHIFRVYESLERIEKLDSEDAKTILSAFGYSTDRKAIKKMKDLDLIPNMDPLIE